MQGVNAAILQGGGVLIDLELDLDHPLAPA